mgnify:CR=1 FL=1
MILDYQFKDENLINTAFTHSSYANEHKVICNERLELIFIRSIQIGQKVDLLN